MEKGNRLYHLADRYIGIPIIFLLGLFKKRGQKKPATVKRIAIINLFSIGDNVLMSGVIADLVSMFPRAEFVAFTATNNYQLVRLIPGFHQIIKLPIVSPLQTIKLIKNAGAFDMAFDFGAWPRISAIYTCFINAPVKTGFNSKNQFRHYGFTNKIPYLHNIHEIDNYRNLVKDFYSGSFHMPTINFQKTEAVSFFTQAAGSYCIIHPWPGGYKNHLKQWDNNRWIELLYKIGPYFDTLVLTGAPSDKEKCSLFENLVDKTKLECRFINACGKFSLGETAFLLKEATYVISIDTGIAHMAAAFDKPMISIQGPASSIRWRPYNPTATVVNPSGGTFGYLSFGFEYNRAKENCMENISVDSVFEAFIKSGQIKIKPDNAKKE